MSTTTPVSTLDPRAQKFGNVVKYGFLVLGLAFAAPFLWLALGGLLGLIALGLTWTATWMLRPWVFMKAANLRLRFIKQEAMKNPTETLLNTYRERSIELDKREIALKELRGRNETLSEKTQDVLERTGPQDRDYQRLKAAHGKMVRVYQYKVTKLAESQKAQDDFKNMIEIAQIKWEAGLAAVAAGESSGYTEDDFFRELRTDTAFDAINTTFNSAVGAIDVDVDIDEAGRIVQALPSTPPAINVTAQAAETVR